MKQIKVKLVSSNISMTNALRCFVMERSQRVISRNVALTDLKVELGLDEESGSGVNVFALGVARFADQEVIVSSTFKNPFTAITSMFHKLDRELRAIRRSEHLERKSIKNAKIEAKIPQSKFEAPGFAIKES